MKTPLFLLALSASALHAQWALLDDMEDGNHWTGFGTLASDPADATNQVYTVENTGTQLVNYLPLATPIPDGTTATLFFRFRSSVNNGLADWVIGSSDQAAPTSWPDYEGYIRFSDGGSPNDIDIDTRNGAIFSEVGAAEADTWINVWLVLDNSADNTDVYYNTSSLDATSPDTISFLNAGFRNGTTDALITLLAINNEANTTTHLDDLYLDLSGENLTHPFAQDLDNDGMIDSWEVSFFGDTSRDGSGDFDGDTLSDLQEYTAATNPTLKDSDGDTIDDNLELDGSANPFNNSPTDPRIADSDGDGYHDGDEAAAASDPNDPASIPTRPSGFQLVEDFEGVGMTIGETFDGINGWTSQNPAAISVTTAAGSTDQVGRLERLVDATTSSATNKSIDALGLQILDGEIGTLFMQVLASSPEVDASFGLSDQAAPTAFSSFEAQGILFPGGNLRARDGEVFRNQGLFAANTWMNVWIVADNATDQFKIFVESPDGQSGQIEITDDGGIDPFNFRNGTTDRLSSILLISAVAGEAGSLTLIDNIYLDPTSENLSRPAPSKQSSSEDITITSTFIQANGDLVVIFSPDGEGFVLTTSPDLSSPFTSVENATFVDGNTFFVPAAELSSSKQFFRVEKP